MESVYLVDGCRSPIGRGHPEKGIFKDLRADELAVQTLQALLQRTGATPAKIDEFYLGCVGQHREQGKNLARLVWLLAGLPQTVPGVTINRLCASSLTALQFAADSIRCGTNHLAVVGGVEHLGHVPMTAAIDYHPDLFKESEFPWNNMGLTAEKLAEQFEIGRVEQDIYTVESNRRYFAAQAEGFFKRERIEITLPDGNIVTEDQEPRLSDLQTLSTLKPVFKEGGTLTAANSSGISDGACMALIAGERTLKQEGWTALAEVGPCVTIGLDPTVMGLGPVGAIRKLLKKTNLDIEDIDLWEINEAFAVQMLACQRELGIASERLNIHGGAVALGHPLGMSGLRLAVTLAHSLVAKEKQRGIAALCVGHGQGVAMFLEKVN
ncbi:MAG: thiolase family protein [Fidelibacterota bacterium]